MECTSKGMRERRKMRNRQETAEEKEMKRKTRRRKEKERGVRVMEEKKEEGRKGEERDEQGRAEGARGESYAILYLVAFLFLCRCKLCI